MKGAALSLQSSHSDGPLRYHKGYFPQPCTLEVTLTRFLLREPNDTFPKYLPTLQAIPPIRGSNELTMMRILFCLGFGSSGFSIVNFAD